MTQSFQYPDTFYRLAVEVLNKHPEIKHQWNLDEKKQMRELIFSKSHENGFDVGVCCRTYGIYPWISNLWWGPCWDINTPKTTYEEMSLEVLGLLRILLSPDSRVRIVLKGKRQSRFFLEFQTPAGWRIYAKRWINLAALFGGKSEVVYQNKALPLQSGFDGSDDSCFKNFGWRD